MVPILVIDHDKARLADTAAVLSSHGYCPLTARFDDEAVVLLNELPIEVVLVEWPPATPDQRALVDAIRRDHPDVAIVAVTDGNEFGRAHAAAALRALDVAAVVARPFAPATLINAIGRCLRAAAAA